MSLESLHGSAGQESPGSDKSAEANHNLVIQKDSEEEQVPMDVTPVPVLPDSDDLEDLLLGWISTPDWSTSQTYLQTHPELLTELAEQALAMLIPLLQDRQVQKTLSLYQQLLQVARQQGVEDAYEILLQQNDEVESASYLSNLGSALRDRYLRMGALGDLERAITAFEQAVDVTPPGSPDLPGHLSNLGIALSDYYTCTGVLDDLEQAIALFRQAVEATPSDSPNHSTYLTNLGSGLHHLYLRTGALDDLEQSIIFSQQAVEATPPNSPNRSTYLSNLSLRLRDRYRRTGALVDLERAITFSQQAVKATSLDSLNLPLYLNNLGLGLCDWYMHTGVLDDLERAITVFKQAVEATPLDAPNRSTYLNNLGSVLRDCYLRMGALGDLERAITAFEQAVDVTPPDAPNRSIYLSNLGGALRDRYLRMGALGDLERAITAFEQAVDVTPPGSPDLARHLSNLGSGLSDRYLSTGALDDLERAIVLSQQAVEATLPNSPNHSTYLANLGGKLRDRYTRTGVLDDLERAITAFEQAVDVTPPNAPNRSTYLSNLGSALSDRYRRARVLGDLERTIAVFQQVVEATLPGTPNRSTYLSNLGSALLDHYLCTGALDDLEQSIIFSQQAVEATPPDSPDLARHLSNLGSALRERYLSTGALDDLERAITFSQQAVEATPSDSPIHSIYLTNLGIRVSDLYEHTGTLVDLERVITIWETIWSLLHLRFVALPIAYQLGQQRQSVHMVASLVAAHLERSVKHRPTARIDRCRALEVAEGNKSRLLTQLVGRGPLPLPKGVSPEIVAREQRLLSDLTALDTVELATHNQPASVQEEAGSLNRLQQRQANLKELEDLWVGIARVGPEGMEYAALRCGAAPTWQELTHLAQELGSTTALLSFFTTTDRALLFLLQAGWRIPRVVEVPLNQAGWADLLERFFREVHRYGPGLRRSETWDQALRPLFTKAQRHLEGVERLILAPAGNGHLLPWGVLAERAGWHTSTGRPLPLVTLPALGILPRLRQRQHVFPGPALVIGNPHGDLPYAEVEAIAVAKRFGTKPLLGAVATKSAVLTRLPEATLIHLATHAFFDAENPLESGIVLANGVLTAREILQHRLQADLLVLSACESGQVGSLGGEELAGLSQAFLQAGVRSLLVSLWRVNDPATAAFIQAFYTARQAGADKALALRQAMTQIRQDPRWTHLYYWGAFVLLGDWD